MSEPRVPPTRSQIDKLGQRLKAGEVASDVDLELIGRYQASFAPLLSETIELVRAAFVDVVPSEQFEVTVRSKQLHSITAKLQRENTRLSSMQDLVGFRIVVRRAIDQESLVNRLRLDDSWRIMDRRKNPSHGYRAVHVIRRGGEGIIEIQVRTFLQHQWAELSEIYDRVSPGVKYGGGAPELQETLGTMSETIAGIEQMELLIQQSQQHHDAMHKQMIVLLERAVRVASEVIEP